MDLYLPLRTSSCKQDKMKDSQTLYTSLEHKSGQICRAKDQVTGNKKTQEFVNCTVSMQSAKTQYLLHFGKRTRFLQKVRFTEKESGEETM